MERFVIRVEKGESLLSVCRKYRLMPERTIRENYLVKEPSEGELLYVSRVPKKLHVAEAGESYRSIAKRYAKSEEELKRINGAEYVFYSMPVVIED